MLQLEGVQLRSETDTEVIAHLIGLNYKKTKDFKKSVQITLSTQIQGSYALAIMNKYEPESLIVARCGSPLLVGKGEDFFIVSSDSAAFQKYTDSYFHLGNMEVVELKLDMNLEHIKIQKAIKDEILVKPKEGFTYFMEQEINEQPDTINRAMNYGARLRKFGKNSEVVKLGGLDDNKEYLKAAKNVIIVACGTSFFASSFAAILARKLGVFNTTQVIDGSGFSEDMIPKDNPLAIIVSQSGESFDILQSVQH